MRDGSPLYCAVKRPDDDATTLPGEPNPMRLIPQLGIVILLAALAAGGGWYWTAESERGDEVPSARPASAVAVETTPHASAR